MFTLLISTILLSLTAAAPSNLELLPNNPVLTKTVTYAAQPTVTGYKTAIIKPQLLALPPLLKSNIVAAAPTHVEVHERTLAKVGAVVESVPTAVSHQSSTIVHSRAQRVTPIVATAMRRSYAAPAVRNYVAAEDRLFEHTPMLRREFPAELSPAAAFVHANVPYQLRAYNAVVPFNYANYGYSNYGLPLVYAAAMGK